MVIASEKWGFFKLVDHGVDSQIIENFTTKLHEVFDLPMDQKLKGGRSANLPLGYFATNPDYGQNLPWAEIIQLLQSPQHATGFAMKILGDQHQPFRYIICLKLKVQFNFYTFLKYTNFNITGGYNKIDS